MDRKLTKCLVFLLFLFINLTNLSIACELRVRVPEGNTFLPYFVRDDESGRWSGLSIELAEALLKEAGCKTTYIPLPFARALVNLKEGEIDLMLNLIMNDERKTYTHFIGPQLDNTVMLVTRKGDSFTINSAEDLKNLPLAVGVDRGKVYGRAIEDLRSSDQEFVNKLEVVNEVDINQHMLAIGRISGFLGFKYNIAHQQQNNPLYKDFTVNPFIFSREWVYFGFSQKSVSKEMLEKLQDAYDRIVERGELEKIRQRYSSSNL